MRHIFYSDGAARAFSALKGVETQSVMDLVKEMSSSVNVNIITEEESLIAFLRSGAPVEDLNSMKVLQTFLKVVGETSKVHKLVAGDSSEKKIEKYSEITLNFYKMISEMGKSEAEDFGEFVGLFPLKHDLSANYVSHLPSFLAPFNSLFTLREEASKKEPKILKMKFPDLFAEIRWISRDISSKKGLRAVVVPDDYLASAISKELELYGIEPTIASPVSEVFMNDSHLNFAISTLRCIDEDFSYESMISILENPYSGIDRSRIHNIKKQCYEKNITGGIGDWKNLLQEMKVKEDLLLDLESLSINLDHRDGLSELVRFLNKYTGERSLPGKLVGILASSFDGEVFEPTELINALESMKSLPKVSVVGDFDVIIGKPLDLLGLPIDNLYLAGQDAASSIRAFPEEARDFLVKTGLEDRFDRLVETAYRSLIEHSDAVTLSCSKMDEKLSYTESTAFYDGVLGDEMYVQRDSVFIPQDPIAEWETSTEYKVPKSYWLEDTIVSARIEKPIYPTFIENYAGCHFKGFVNGMLGIDEIDPPREFLDPRTTGSMTHKILEKYYSTDITPTTFGKLADSFVKGEISKERYESRMEALKFYRDKYILNGKLVRFFKMDVEHALELGRKTVQKEFHFPISDQQVVYNFGDKKISLGGYVDRVDEENGGLCVIDYKSSLYGYPKNDLCDERHYKVQLYFYKLGVEAIMKKKVRAAAYVSFRDINDGFSTAGFFNSIPNEEAQVKKCKEIIDPVLEEFVSGDCDPVVKEGGSLWKCENELFCPLLSVCRVQERRW